MLNKLNVLLTALENIDVNDTEGLHKLSHEARVIKLNMQKHDLALLAINSTQLNVVAQATELMARVGMGQLNYLRDQYMDYTDIDTDRFCSAMEKVDAAGRELGLNYGIHSEKVPERVKAAWDIHQVVCQKISLHDKPQSSVAVNFDKPLKKVASSPLPLCEYGEK